MKPVPFAQYLERQQKAASRGAIEPVNWPQRDQATAEQEKPRSSPLLRRVETGGKETAAASSQRVDQGRRAVFEEGREAARREFGEERAAMRDRLDAEVAKARAQWVEEEGGRLASAHRAAIEDFEMRCAQAVANILRPFLSNLVIGRVTELLVENLEVLFTARTPALFEVSGPADMLDALREKFAAHDASVEFKPDESMDIRVRVDDTIIETQLGAWMTALGAMPRDACDE